MAPERCSLVLRLQGDKGSIGAYGPIGEPGLKGGKGMKHSGYYCGSLPIRCMVTFRAVVFILTLEENNRTVVLLTSSTV